MNLILLILGNLLICFLVLFIAKDFLHPGFLFCVPWIIFLSFLFLSDYDYDSSSFCYIYFFIGTIIFELGCFIGIGHKRVIRKERLLNRSDQIYYVNYQSIKILTFMELIFVLYVLYSYFVFIRSHFTVNVFLSYHMNRYEMSNISLIGYGRNFFSAFGICTIIGYSHVSLHERKRYRKYMIIQLLLYVPMTLTRMTRNEILFVILPIFMAFIVVTKQNNIQVLKKMIVAVAAFLVLFGTVAVMKYHTLFANGNFFNTMFDQLLLYGCGAFVAFQKEFDAMSFMGYEGTNTFRFFIAIYDKIAGTELAQPLIQQFINIGNGLITNVYTFYYWYANDFGVLYALFVQFIVGILHGISYRKMSQMSLYGIYIYCLFIHPLVMQIFQDQYFSLLSSWIQFLLFGFVFLQTNILFSKSKNRSKMMLKVYDNYE